MITQDDEGVLYFANSEGLLSYNGSQWELYKTPNGSIMRSVKFDDGRVYTGCFMDFGYWETDQFGRLGYTSIVEESGVMLKEDEQFWNIIITADYILFQSLSNIYSYDRSSKKVELLVSEPGITKFFKADNSYYYQVQGKGLFQIINKKPVPLNMDGKLDSNKVIEIFNYKGFVHILTEDAKLYALNADGYKQIADFQVDGAINVYHATFVKSEETLILGTIANGVWSVGMDGTSKFQIDRSNGLANNTVLSTFTKDNNNVWLGLDNGIALLNIQSRFSKYVDQIGVLGTTYASAYYGDITYLGTNQGLFYKKKDGSNFEKVVGTSGQVWSLDVIDGKLFCSHDAGIFIINDINAEKITSLRGMWFVDSIEGDPDQLYAGSYNGIHFLRKIDGSWKYDRKLSGFNISSKDVVLSDDTFYVNHEYKGIYKLKIDQNKSKVIETLELDGIDMGNNSDLLKYKSDIIYTNRGGIHVLDTNTDKSVKNTELTALFADNEFVSSRMQVTEDGYLWLFTRNYLAKISKEGIDGTYRVECIAINENIRNEMKGFENISLLDQQNYLLGTSFGYMILNSNAPEVSFEHRISIQSIKYLNGEVTTPQPLDASIDLSFVGNKITFDYSSNSFKALHPTLFQYRLKKNAQWSNWSRSSSVTFENLDHGDYYFEVRSQVNSELSKNVASYSFSVKKPFYISTVAIIIYIFGIIFMGFAINYAYLWYFKRINQRALNRQQKELQVINLKTENDLIQLRNDKLRADVEHRNKELAVATMGTIKKNELVNEISDIVKDLPDSPGAKNLKKLVKKNMSSKQDWITFEEAFNNADKDFFKKVKEMHPGLTTGDLRLCVYLRLNLSSKEIAPLLHISPRSVEIKRYRLRKKMDLDKETNLNDYIIQI
jgi:DNA-binding CsgD family transcriptional regulator